MGQLSHPYMTTGKTIALTRWTFSSKVMSQYLALFGQFWVPGLMPSALLMLNTARHKANSLRVRGHKIFGGLEGPRIIT